MNFADVGIPDPHDHQQTPRFLGHGKTREEEMILG